MKKELLTLIFIVSFLVSPGYASAVKKSDRANPLKEALENLINQCGVYGSTINYSENVYEGNSAKEDYEITSITCRKADRNLEEAINIFMAERDNGYSYVYIEPSQEGNYDVKLREKTLPLRTKGQQMWMISKKNPDDPRLIDIYTLTLAEESDGKVDGKVALITKLRTDLVQIDNQIDSQTQNNLANDSVLAKRKMILTAKIEGYNMVIEQYKQEIAYLQKLCTTGAMSGSETLNRVGKISDKMGEINSKIEKLIEQYINSIE